MANEIVTIASGSDFLAFIRDQAMPGGNLSIRGVARCCGVEDTSIIRGAAFNNERLGQTLLAHGFESAALREDGFPAQAVWLCIEYFAFESRAKAPMAKQLARTFGAIGIVSTLSRLTATTVPTVAPTGPSKELVAAREIAEIEELLESNPRLAQILTDSLVNRVLEKVLPGTAPELRGLAEIATEMGYRINQSNRVRLGQKIALTGSFSPIKERRLCNGVSTEINCYRDTPELREAIATFFVSAGG